ncbi:store-operated calcium entry-associated regulatory factor-like [Paramacrobiotus metropolitanus]|uniref:store-operated calcium entry-associated regulatory factor-like n=1 Tax=Paramacrobiotus metropolitanus TaxID=2943436 RepID=UPI00244592E1|nr:store-operated calcium entry-associated regulatory factor-like [Paramacrobiotus metropolitanus]
MAGLLVSIFMFLMVFSSLSLGNAQQWGRQANDRVLLSDVQTLTLHQGKMTAARRTRAVPQLACVGGTAGCSAFVPQTVQCYNRGSDGMDVQWECKTDMDNDFRFGQIEVVCEGYEHPEDPYVLKGSCGMEYTLDLTKEGVQHRKTQGSHQSSYSYAKSPTTKTTDGLRTPWYISTLFLIGVIWFIYKIYRTCVAQRQFSTTNSDHPQGPGHNPSSGGGSSFGSSSRPYGAPPPYPGDSSAFPGESCNANRNTGTAGARGGGGPGFWSGMGAGAGLGYLFGRRNTGGSWFGGGYNRAPPYNPSYDYGSSSTSYSSGFGGGTSSTGSSGSREASGFGGTRRR